MPIGKPNPLSRTCASRRFVELVAEKWTMLVLYALQDGPKRNGELLRLVEGISQKMLTQTLRRLDRHGLVLRDDKRTIPPHVEYRLSELGVSCGSIIRSLDAWFDEQLSSYAAGSANGGRGNGPAETDIARLANGTGPRKNPG